MIFHILLVAAADIIWFLFGIAFPVYALARSGVLGYRSGLVVRLPAKLLVISFLGAVASQAVNAALMVSSSVCFQLEYSAYRFYSIVLPVFVIAMLASRAGLFEPRLARMVRREEWNGRLRVIDGVAGAILDVIAMVFVLDIFLLAIGLRSSPVTSYPAGLLSSGPFRGVPLVDNLPALFDGVLQLEQKLHVSQSAYALIGKSCPVDVSSANTYSGIYLWTALMAIIVFAPLAFTLAFQSLTYLGHTVRPDRTGQGACGDCHGTGTYGPDRPLLFAGLCERCLGTGHPLYDDQHVPGWHESSSLLRGSLVRRSYIVVFAVFGLLPVLVGITRFRS